MLAVILKRLLPLLPYLLAAAAIAYVLYLLYSAIWQRGFDAKAELDAPVILRLETDLKGARAQIDGFKTTVANMASAYKTAEAQLKTDYESLLKQQRDELAAKDRRIRTLKEKLKNAAQDFVPPRADAGCIVNRGFVQYHDLAADSNTPAEAFAVPPGGPADAGEPSGVALSAVAATVGDNYATCHGIRQKLLMWQGWYPKAKEAYDSAAKAAGTFTTVQPLPVAP